MQKKKKKEYAQYQYQERRRHDIARDLETLQVLGFFFFLTL